MKKKNNFSRLIQFLALSGKILDDFACWMLVLHVDGSRGGLPHCISGSASLGYTLYNDIPKDKSTRNE